MNEDLREEIKDPKKDYTGEDKGFEDFKSETAIEEESEEELEEELEDGGNEEQVNLNYLLYMERTKKFIKKIGEKEGLDISFKKEAEKTLQDHMKLIIALLSYEIIDELKAQGKKRIDNLMVKSSIDNILSQSDALNVAIESLNETIEKMKLESKESSLQRATNYVNFEEDENNE